MAAGLSKKQSSILFQLRKGHAPLNKYLHRIGSSELPEWWACGAGEETVNHYLMVCARFVQQRWEVRQELGQDAGSLKVLLNQSKALEHLFKYINATGYCQWVAEGTGGREQVGAELGGDGC